MKNEDQSLPSLATLSELFIPLPTYLNTITLHSYFKTITLWTIANLTKTFGESVIILVLLINMN